MIMTHYMELLSLHEPWFLILFMLVPMVLAETILAAGAFSLLYRDARSQFWDELSHAAGLVLGVFFLLAAGYIVLAYVPGIDWRGPIDVISVWAYVLGVIPSTMLLLQELGLIFRHASDQQKIKNHLLLMILFVLFTHLAMVFGMANPQLAGYVPPQQTMDMMHQGAMNGMDHSNMDHSNMDHGVMNCDDGDMDHSNMHHGDGHMK